MADDAAALLEHLGIPWLSTWAHAAERGVEANELALSLMPWFLTPAFMTQHDQVEEALVEMISEPFPAPPQGIAAQAAACRTHDALARLPLITAPTLERGGHVPQLEYPEAVTEVLLDFLAV